MHSACALSVYNACSRRHDGPTAFAKADAHVAFTAAVRAQDHAVAILQEAARFARGQLDAAPAAGRDLKETAEPFRLRARARAGAEQAPRPQVAAAATVMGDELRHGPIEMPCIAGREAMGR